MQAPWPRHVLGLFEPPGTAPAHFQGASCLPPSLPPQLIVTFENNEFKVKLPDGHQLTFPNRLGHSHLSYLGVQDFIVSSFKLE